MNFKITCKERNNYEIPYTTKIFAGGEVQVKLLKFPVAKDGENFGNVLIDGMIKSSDMLMELLLIANALRSTGICGPIAANIHYLPYARQDRVCSAGEAFALENFMWTLTNSCLEKIIIEDAHSAVAMSLASEIYPDSGWEFVSQTELISGYIESGSFTLVSPDNGAAEKTVDLGIATDNSVIQYFKTRDLTTGAISETKLMERLHGVSDISKELIEGKDCLIVDDICDGGRTFAPIIEDLLVRGAESVSLCVTHAILPYGLDALKEAGLDSFFYVNSFLDEDLSGMYHVSNINKVIKGEI